MTTDKSIEQKIKDEAMVRYPQFNDLQIAKHEAYIAGRSQGLERERALEAALADLAFQYKMVVSEQLEKVAINFDNEIDHLPAYKKAIELLKP